MTANLRSVEEALTKVDLPIFFFTNDAKVALGLEKVFPQYHIVCIDDNSVVDYLKEDGVQVFCYEQATGKRNTLFRNSAQLLDQPEVLHYLREHAPQGKLAALFFKPTGNISRRLSSWQVTWLNNPPALNWRYENKLEFFRRFQASFPLPPGEIVRLEEGYFPELRRRYGDRVVVQFSRGWAGNTTYFVQNQQEWTQLQQRFPLRQVRVSAWAGSLTAINNACLTPTSVLVSSPFRQVTGVSQWNRYLGGTCGNSWDSDDFTKDLVEQTLTLTERLGAVMRQDGYRGLFGVDMAVDAQRVLLLENNARLTAPIPMFTKLEIMAGRVPLLAYHWLTFLGMPDLPLTAAEPPNLRGGQVVLRNVAETPLRVEGSLKPGIYVQSKSRSGEWIFVRPAYSVEHLRSEAEYLLLPAMLGRVVNPDIEYLRIQSLEPVLDLGGNLRPEVWQLGEWGRGQLKLSHYAVN